MKVTATSRFPRRLAASKTRQPGFSLIVTITMLILLSLIAVGLLSLSSITLRASGNQQATIEARANARVALALALGELQRLAGQDQRITATADLAGDASGNALSVGSSPLNNNSLDGSSKGLSSLQAGTRYWTGVFTNNDDPSQIYRKTPSASLQGWLVSDPSGQTQSGSGRLSPSNQAFSANPDGTASNPDQAVVLVGPNTFGNRGGSVDTFVTAPLIKITDGENQTGSLAWWVGDENVKSRINRSSELPAEENFATLSPQRRGWEVVNGMSNYPEASDPFQSSLERVISLPSTELLVGGVTSNLGGTESLFHAATAQSIGLHTNALEGGFKVDLTTALENGLTTPNVATQIDNYPSRGNPIIPSVATSEPLSLLKWERLEPFYDRIKNSTTNNELTVQVDTVADGATAYATAPTLLEFRIVLGARVKGAQVGRVRSTTQVNIDPCGKVLFVLANPYSQPLKWDKPLEFQLRHQNGHIRTRNKHSSRIWQANTQSVYFPVDETVEQPGSEPAVFNQVTFELSADSLPPGQARVYTQAAPLVRNRSRANVPVTVPLVAMSATDLEDFNNCVEMSTDATHNLPKSLDVREQTCTSLIQLEMRLEDQTLRRYSGFELNNTAWRATQTQKRFTTPMIAPVPLIAYRFQVSQPGVEYIRDFLPNGTHGQRASALRTYADFNLQATHFDDPITSYTPPPFFFRRIDSHSQINGQIPNNNALTGNGFTEGLFEDPLPWGYSNVTGSQQTILYSIPRALSSLAQLQHLDLTNDNTKVSLGHQPAYAVGNSYATPFVRRELIEQSRTDYRLEDWGIARQTQRNYYDISYLLNASLWDRFFFSTIVDSQSEPLNPNQVLLSDSARGADAPEVAAHLVNSGMFNVNSTSVNAWKAFLASSRDYLNGQNSPSSSRNSFPRSLQHLPIGLDSPSGAETDSYAGRRLLSDAEIDVLAREIVRQVRIRGPFLSFSHFVNRSLANATAETEVTRSGPLQQALDESGININATGSISPFSQVNLASNRAAFAFNGSNPTAEITGGSGAVPASSGSDPDWATNGFDRNHKSLSSIVADRDLAIGRRGSSAEFGSRHTSIPAWVTQADVLQFLAPSMSVRSDTFRIRTCGRSQDANGNIRAVAYAEAIVQRTPEFVDPTNASTQPLDSLNSTNQVFGRRFTVTSFRWLKENEI